MLHSSRAVFTESEIALKSCMPFSKHEKLFFHSSWSATHTLLRAGEEKVILHKQLKLFVKGVSTNHPNVCCEGLIENPRSPHLLVSPPAWPRPGSYKRRPFHCGCYRAVSEPEPAAPVPGPSELLRSKGHGRPRNTCC